MHLYLSSFRFGGRADELRSLARSDSAVVIANALDYSEDVARKRASSEREMKQLGELGFSATELDLRDCFGRPEALRDVVPKVGLLWVMGGNAFLLRRAFRASGLDEYLLSRRGDPSLVYGGYSAGAIVATPTLRGIELVDPPGVIAPGYDEDIIWEGLGLVPYSLAPHYKSAHADSKRMDDVVGYFVANAMPFRALRDGEVIVERASAT
jgi:dipeptidase E